MPQNAFPPNIPNFPISGNNEPIAIEPLENAVQAVLNRTENLHVRLGEAETQGVKRVQTVNSLAALSAATGFNNGDVCDVEGYGRYRLYNPSALTADGLWVLTAAGGGRWVHVLRDMRGIGNGLATLDSGQRLAQDVRDGSIQTQHIANQAITSAKLAPGAVVGHLGYTPLNKAGDTWTGDLIGGNLYSGSLLALIGDIDQAKWLMHLGNFSISFYSDYNNTVALSGLPNHAYYGRTYRPKASFTPEGHLNIAGEYRGRYDHTNRFSFCAMSGQDINIAGGGFQVLGRTFVSVPSGRALYLRRVRAYTVGGSFRARVAALYGNIWVASAETLDADIDQLLRAGPASDLVYIGVDNISGSSGNFPRGSGAWVELEIR
jgi:hypothetical protein